MSVQIVLIHFFCNFLGKTNTVNLRRLLPPHWIAANHNTSNSLPKGTHGHIDDAVNQKVCKFLLASQTAEGNTGYISDGDKG